MSNLQSPAVQGNPRREGHACVVFAVAQYGVTATGRLDADLMLSAAEQLNREDRFFVHLLDGSRAANRLGWQWTVGTGTGRAYGSSRRQVERRAPDLCSSCGLRDHCPIEEWPPDPVLAPVESHPLLRRDPNPPDTARPVTPIKEAEPAKKRAKG